MRSIHNFFFQKKKNQLHLRATNIPINFDSITIFWHLMQYFLFFSASKFCYLHIFRYSGILIEYKCDLYTFLVRMRAIYLIRIFHSIK